MNKLTSIVGITLLSTFSTASSAAVLSPTNVSGAGGTYFNLPNISDSYVPREFSDWRSNTTFWNGTSRIFTFDYGSLFNIEDVLVSVDNNDSYKVEWSTNGSTWADLFQITVGMGDVWNGMDTMTTFAGAEYVPGIDFAPVQAQYLRIFATGGDNSYSVGELIAYGSAVSAVPIPAAALLFAPAFLGFMGLRRKAKNTFA